MRSLQFAGRRLSLTIEPSFWLVMGVLIFGGGFPSGADAVAQVLRLFVVFAASLLLHEGGHACAVLLFGGEAAVRLHGMGGETRHALKLSTAKQFLVTSAGPLAGGATAAASFFLFRGLRASGRLEIGAALFLAEMFRVNAFWSVVNLLPILPMDGGKLVALVLTARFGNAGLKSVYGLAVLLGGALALLCARSGQWFGAATFGLFAASGARSWRELSRRLPLDDDPALQAELQETARLPGKEALPRLIELRRKTGRGRIHEVATELLANALFETGQRGAALTLLSTVDERLSYPSRVLLMGLRRESGDLDGALALGRTLFLEKRDPYVAYVTAAAHAGKGERENALRWLKTVVRGGLEQAPERLKEKDFDALRGTPEFEELERAARDRG